MSRTHSIADLPDKILQNIFELAINTSPNSAGFLNTSLVCKKWSMLISESNIIMRKVKPKITLEYTENVENSSTFSVTRPYRQLEIAVNSKSGWDFEEGKYLSTNPVLILSTIASSPSVNHLRELTLHYVPLTAYFFGALHSLDKLEKLSIFHCTLEKDIKILPVGVKSLKVLIYDCMSGNILSLLKCKELDTLIISTKHPYPSSIDFLKQLDFVHQVTIRIRHGDFFFHYAFRLRLLLIFRSTLTCWDLKS